MKRLIKSTLKKNKERIKVQARVIINSKVIKEVFLHKTEMNDIMINHKVLLQIDQKRIMDKLKRVA